MDARPFGFFDFARSWRHFLLRSGGCALAGLCGLILLLLPGCDGLGLVGGNGGPRLTEIPGKIVFAAERAGDDYDNIYVIDGNGLRQLTDFRDESTFAINPAFSPDGEQIAFSACLKCTTLGPTLYLIDSDGSDRRLFKQYPSGVPEGVVGWNPVWSPTGDRLAYSRCMNCEAGGGNYEVFVSEVAGRVFEPDDETRLTTHLAEDGGAAWSPGETMLVFTSNRSYVRGDSARFLSDLYVKNADGRGDAQRLTDTGYVGLPIWHPNGEEVICGLNGEKNKGKLLLVNPNNGSTVPVNANLSAPFTLIPIEWSPDAERLLIMAVSVQENRIYVLDMESREASRVTLPNNLEITGQPDWFVESNN